MSDAPNELLLPRVHIGIDHDEFSSLYIADEHTLGEPDQAEYIRLDIHDAEIERLRAENATLRETHLLQLAGISTAAMGYHKASDSIHPDFKTVALDDVMELYAKYDALFQAALRGEKP